MPSRGAQDVHLNIGSLPSCGGNNPTEQERVYFREQLNERLTSAGAFGLVEGRLPPQYCYGFEREIEQPESARPTE